MPACNAQAQLHVHIHVYMYIIIMNHVWGKAIEMHSLEGKNYCSF